MKYSICFSFLYFRVIFCYVQDLYYAIIHPHTNDNTNDVNNPIIISMIIDI
jgi:hypothetical protein